MKKYYLVRNNNNAAGAELKIVDGDIVTMVDVKLESDGKAWRLPDNETGRKWVFISKLKDVDEVEILPRAKAEVSATIKSSTPLEDYLEGDEREMYIKLRDKSIAAATKAKEDAKAKAKADAELKRKLEAFQKAKAEYEKLLKGGN